MPSKTVHLENACDTKLEVAFSDSTPVLDVDWLIALLQKQLADGVTIEPGETISVGSMLLNVQGDGVSLHLAEPDFKSTPIKWCQGVSQSLQMLRMQKDTVESVKLEQQAEFPDLRSSLIVSKDLGAPSRGLVMDRSAPDEMDTGWFVGLADSDLDYNDAENLTRISVYEAIIMKTDIVDFLALPPGSNVLFHNGELNLRFKGNNLVPVRNSYLYSKYKFA